MKRAMAFLLLSMLSVLSGGDVYRELHIPSGELPLLLESWPSAVLLPQSEFMSLLARSRSVADEPSPVGAVLLAGSLEMTIEADRALLVWRGEAAVPAEGWQRLRLVSAGIVWRGVEAARQSLYVRAHAAEGLELLLTSGGEHFALHGECRLERQAAQSRLSFRLPDAAVQNWVVRAAGDVVIRSGARVLERRHDSGSQVTTFRLLPERGAVELVFSMNDRLRQNERLLTAASQIELVITEQEEMLQAETVFSVSHQPCAAFAFRLPAGMEVIEVGCAEGRVAAWRQAATGELQVELHEPVSSTVRMQIRARRPFMGRDWNFSGFQPLSCYVVSSRGLVRLSRRLQAEPVQGEGVRWLELPSAPAEALAVPWLAFQGLEGYRLRAALVPSGSELAVVMQADCHVDEAGQRLQLQLALTARGEPCFAVGLRLPSGWQPEESVAVEGGELERDGAGYRLLPSGGCPPGETRSMRLTFRHTPADWFSGWEQPRQLAFPEMVMPGVRWRGGVQRLHLQGDLQGELTEYSGCRVTVVEALATERLTEAVFAGEPGRLSWQLTLPPPRLSGETYSRYQVENDRLMLAHELVWQISGSHVNHVAFRLPPGTPEAVSLRGEPVAVRDYRSEVDTDGWRRFQVHLSGRVMGELRVGAAYPQPVSWVAGKVRLPIPVLEGVSYQSGRLAVEGHPEYQVEISGAPRRIDAGEVSGLAARPGKRLLGCYAYLGALPEVWVQAVRQEVAALPACLVQHCRIDTLVSASGRRQSTAEYQLRPNLNALHLRLPAGSVLWGVTLDGKPAVLLDKGGELWVQMSGGEPGALRRLQVSWENSGGVFSLLGQAVQDQPELSYAAADGSRQAVPVADVHWQIYPPEDYRLLFALAAGGGGESGPAAALVRWMYRCLGGIDPTHGFPGCMVLPALKGAREKARLASKLYADKIMEQELPSEPAAAFSREAGVKAKEKMEGGRGSVRGVLTTSGRSLHIQLGRMSGGVSRQSLGGAESGRLVFVRASAWRALRRALFMFFLLAGFWLYSGVWRRRLWFAGVTALVSGLLPCLPGCGGLGEVLNPLFILALVFPVAWLMGDVLRRRLQPARGGLVLLLLLFVQVNLLSAAPVATPFRRWEPRPLPMPADAVVFPYGVDGQPSGQVLVPRGLYERLQPVAAEPSRPGEYAALPMVYRGELAGDEGLVLQGSMLVQIFRSGAVLLPELAISGVRLEAVEVDGRPATVWQEGETLRLVLSGRGEHVVTVRARCPVRKQGGWQMAALRLPVLDGLGSLVLEKVPAGIELLVASGLGSWSRAAWPAAADVPLSLDGGELRLQWRPEASRSELDTTLQVESEMILRLEAEAARLTWEAVFHFQDRGRTHFDLGLPEDWQIEAVGGDAIRGWEYLGEPGESTAAATLVVPGTGSLRVPRRRLRVHLLRPAADGERLVLELVSRREAVTAPPQRWDFPALTVPGAQRHRALVLARCLDGVEATAEFAFPLQRTDPGRSQRRGSALAPGSDWDAWISPGEPVPLVFVLSDRPVRPRAQLELVQALSEDGQELSGTWHLSRAAGASAGEVMLCPPGFVPEALGGAGISGWNPVAHPEGPALQIWFSDPSRLERKVTFSGRLSAGLVHEGRYPLACFRLLGYPEQRTVMAVGAPAGWQLREEDCRGIESALPGTLESWLRQRQPVCLAFQGRQAAYSGSVLATSLPPDLSGTLLQTLRLTAQGLEQTLDIALHAAGRLSELSLLLPADWRGTVPLAAGLRSHVYADVAEEPGLVRCQLLFAVPVQGALTLRLQRWRLPAVTGERIGFPQLSGQLQYFLFVENSGRDELVLEDVAGLLPLRARAGLPAAVKARLGAGSGQAWEAGDGRASALLHVRPREEVATAGARIGLSSAVMVLDAAGVCLVEQRLHIDNRTEQFMEIELPPGCHLLTARVAGDLVKPLLRQASQPSRVTLPLVKTAEGDLDYTIVLTCRAELPRPRWGSRWALPLLAVHGISIERSQVELRLPRELRWFALSGSFGSAVDSLSYAGARAQYYQLQVQRLNQALQSSNPFVQQRALQNAKKIQVRGPGEEIQQSPDETELLSRVGELTVQRSRSRKPESKGAVVSAAAGGGRLESDSLADMDGNVRQDALPQPVAASAQARVPAASPVPAAADGATVAANQAGLELQLPGQDEERWQALFFTCPRGASELSLRVIPAGVVRSLQDMLWLLAVLAMVAVLVSGRGRAVFGRVARSVGSRRRMLAWAGILSVLLGVFPLLGGGVLVGLACLRRWRSKGRGGGKAVAPPRE